MPTRPTRRTNTRPSEAPQTVSVSGNHDELEAMAGEAAPALQRGNAMVMDIADLKTKRIDELLKLAADLKIANTSGLRKQELIFEIL